MNVGPGVIDRDFRGKVKVRATNGSNQPLTMSPGEWVAQMVIEEVYEVRYIPRVKRPHW